MKRGVLLFILAMPYSICSYACWMMFCSTNSMAVYTTAHHRIDTSYVIKLNQAAQSYQKSNPDSTFYYASKALSLGRQLRFDRGIEGSSKILATYYRNKGEFKQSLELFRQLLNSYKLQNNKLEISNMLNNIGSIHAMLGSLDIAKDTLAKALEMKYEIKDMKGAAMILNNLSLISKDRGNFSLSLEYLFQILQDSSLKVEPPLKAMVLNNIGIVYKELGSYSEALKYHNQSLAIKQETNDLSGIANSYMNIGQIYENMREYSNALRYYTQSLSIKQKLGEKRSIAYNLHNIGHVYMHQHKLDSALRFLKESLSIKDAINDKRGIAFSANDLSNIYIQKSRPDSAEFYANKAHTFAKSSNIKDQLSLSLKLLSQISEHKGSYKEALLYYQQFKVINDSIFNSDRDRDISRLTIRYKDYENDQLKKDNELKSARIEIERLAKEEKASSFLLLQKEMEAERYLALISIESSKRRSDSLRNLALKAMLEAKNLLITKQKLASTSHLKQLALDKANWVKQLQSASIVLLVVLLLMGTIFTAYLFRSRQKEKRSKELIMAQKEQLVRIKEKLQLQAEHLENSNRSKDRIFSIVAHDLRSPLSTLKNILDLRESKDLSKDELDEMIPLMAVELGSSLDLTEEILYWARSQMQEELISPEKINVAAVLQEQAGRFASAASSKGIKLQLEVPDCSCFVVADINMLRTVLRNLIGNAIKFCKRNDSISIGVERVGDMATIKVADSGIGISPENLAKLLESKSFTTKGTSNEKGTGLGLILCRDFIEKNNGRMRIESHVGSGTSIFLTLPQS